MIVTVNCPICNVIRIYTPPFEGCSETAPLVPNSVPERIVSCKGSFVKIAALGVRRRATGGGFLIIYKVGDCFFRSGGFRRLGRRVTFPAMGKSPKDRRGTPQRRTSFANDGLPPGPRYGGRVPVRMSKISSAQNLSDTLNSRRATGPWVSEN